MPDLFRSLPRKQQYDPGVALNLGCGADVKSGWTNMDGFYEHPEVLKHDLLRTPWPLPDDHFDTVFASHVLEHIPPLMREVRGTQRDVILDVLEEIYRILKPTGRLHIMTPAGGSDLSYCHWQHYRQWSPGWWSYFKEGPESYYSHARFHLAHYQYNPGSYRWQKFAVIRGTPLVEHFGIRFPFLRPILQARDELEMIVHPVKGMGRVAPG